MLSYFVFYNAEKSLNRSKDWWVSRQKYNISFQFYIFRNWIFCMVVDGLSSVTIHSEICLIFVFSIAQTKMHKKSQKFRAFPVFSVIKQRNYPFDNIAKIINHIPVATVQIIELVTPFRSQLYCFFKSLLKYSIVNVYDQLVAHNFTKDFGWKYGLKIESFLSCIF